MRMPETAVERFFRGYERATAQNDVAAIVSFFADPFLAAGPAGARAIGTADFALALPKRIELFEGLGCQPASLVSVTERRVDDRFVIVETRWRVPMRHECGAQSEVVADSLFLVDTGFEPFKIVLYLAHQDLLARVKEVVAAG